MCFWLSLFCTYTIPHLSEPFKGKPIFNFPTRYRVHKSPRTITASAPPVLCYCPCPFEVLRTVAPKGRGINPLVLWYERACWRSPGSWSPSGPLCAVSPAGCPHTPTGESRGFHGLFSLRLPLPGCRQRPQDHTKKYPLTLLFIQLVRFCPILSGLSAQ